MSNVTLFPVSAERQEFILKAITGTDRAITELLIKAVSAYKVHETRAPGSIAGRHNLAIAHAYIDAVAVIVGITDVAHELAQCLDVGIHDPSKLYDVATGYTGPQSA